MPGPVYANLGGAGTPLQSPGPQAPPPGPFSDLDPEQLRRLAELYGIPDEQAADLLRYHRAQVLAGTELPKGRSVRDNIFVASSPLEMGAAAYERVRGMKREDELARRLEALGGKRVAGAEAAYGLYGAQRRKKGPGMYGEPPLTSEPPDTEGEFPY